MVEGLTSIPAPDQGSACREIRVSYMANRDPSTGALVVSTHGRCRHLPDAYNPGDSSGEATPVPIPNTEVKLSSAEDTERAAFRENRSSPGLLHFRRGSARAGSGAHGRAILIAMHEPADEPSATPEATDATPRSKASRRRDADAVIGCLSSPRVGAMAPGAAPTPRAITAAGRCVRRLPSVLAKQRELCLTAVHATCVTFLATRPPSGAR